MRKLQILLNVLSRIL